MDARTVSIVLRIAFSIGGCSQKIYNHIFTNIYSKFFIPHDINRHLTQPLSRLNQCHVSTIVTSQPLKRHGDLVYKFKVIVGKTYFSDQFKKIIKRYKKRLDMNLKELLESLILAINLKKYHYGIQHEYNATVYMSDGKPNQGLGLLFPL